MQAEYLNGATIEEEHETFSAAFLSGEEHMENGAISVRIFKKLDPKRKSRRKMAQASRRRNRR